ncbi:MAG: MotA/TolQ/ExbB proton channel family protein [bacterium]|nr:MotA/TolQ/ExbB proton channel family protein [bacterium]
MFNSIFATAIIGLIILIGLGGAGYRLWFRKSSQLAQMAPSAAVSLGILGTFVGVYIGLKGFDVQNISASIPLLLEGLKTAFMTSIWGIAVSIALRLLYGRLDDQQVDASVLSDDPMVLLQGILNGVEDLGVQTRNQTHLMTEAVVQLNQSAQTRMENLAGEIVQSRRAITASFDAFSDRLTETGMDALVVALEKVIQDFNALLGELVGSAFQDLREAVARLVEWQGNYRDDMERMRERLDINFAQSASSTEVLSRSADSLALVDQRLESTTQSLGKLTAHSTDLLQIVEGLQGQNAQLQASLESVRALGESAKDVIPTVDKQVRKMVESLVQAASDSASHLERANAGLSSFVETSARTMQETVASQTEAMKSAVDRLDASLEEELTRALNALAGSLAALSERFVRDYQPLTERLREVVRLAEAPHDR